MALKIFGGYDGERFFQTVLVGFVALQIISWLISSISDVPILKGGPMLFLFMVVILFITLFSIGKNINTVSLRKEGFFILLVYVTIFIMFIYLPNVIPQIFSVSGIEFKDFLRDMAGQIANMGTGVIN